MYNLRAGLLACNITAVENKTGKQCCSNVSEFDDFSTFSTIDGWSSIVRLQKKTIFVYRQKQFSKAQTFSKLNRSLIENIFDEHI